MKTLVIYAHPQTEGHCSLALEQLDAKLKARNADYEIIDLYRIGYNPVLAANEHYTTYGNRNIAEDTAGFQKKISEADKLIFIYPIWWGSMPAILKGFFDRTFTSGFAFKYEGALPKGLLKGKKAAIIISSGSPSFFTKWFLGNRVQKSIQNDVMGFCGIKANVFQIDNAKKFDDGQKGKIEKQVEKAVEWLM